MNTQHTPGPWITDNSHRSEWEGMTVWHEDVVIGHIVPDQHGQESANARLIAAAPDLLAALQQYVTTYVETESNPTPAEEVKCAIAATDAIAKATGQG